MFLFESISGYGWLGFFGVLFGLIIVNELTRRNKWLSLAVYLVLPIVLTFTLWPKTAGKGSSVGSWFAWAKVYSALAGCVGFMALRYVKGLSDKKWLLAFPPLILSINIMEAVIREFQSFSFNGVVDGLLIIGGPWNIMNGIAGILNIITISGWVGIMISRDKSKDMIWADQLWFWIIAYDLWNFAYVYNCIPDHAFYAGAALLISCTIPAFFIKKGAWLQHRAQTLGLWMMFAMSYSTFMDASVFTVRSSHNTTALMIVSFIALAFNVGVFVYHFNKIIKHKRNPFTTEVHTDLKIFQDIVKDNAPLVEGKKSKQMA